MLFTELPWFIVVVFFFINKPLNCSRQKFSWTMIIHIQPKNMLRQSSWFVMYTFGAKYYVKWNERKSDFTRATFFPMGISKNATRLKWNYALRLHTGYLQEDTKFAIDIFLPTFYIVRKWTKLLKRRTEAHNVTYCAANMFDTFNIISCFIY